MNNRYRLDDLVIDVMRQRVEREGHLLDISGLSFRLLHYLLVQGNRVVGFDEIIEHVWAPVIVNEDTVTQRVRLLRQALGDDGRNPRYLRSVRSHGYQLSSPVLPLEDEISPTLSPSRWVRWRTPSLVATVMLAMAVCVIAWKTVPAPSLARSPLLKRADYYANIGQHDNNERAISLYLQRLQEAPDDSEALLGLSRAHSARVCLYNGELASVHLAQKLAEQVIAREHGNAAAHAALAYAFDCRGDVDNALSSYERALTLDPSVDSVRASAAYLYERRGRLFDALAANLDMREPGSVRFLPIQIASNLDLLGYTDEASSRFQRSFQLYPDNVFSNAAWPAFLMRHGRFNQAQAALDEAMLRGTEHPSLHLLAAELALQRGDQGAARAAVTRAQALRPQASLPRTLQWILADVRPPVATLRAQAESLRAGMSSGGEPFDGVDAALLLDAAGDFDGAIAALEMSVNNGYRDSAYLRASPLFGSLRAMPKFIQLVSSIDAEVARQRDAVVSSGLAARAGITASP